MNNNDLHLLIEYRPHFEIQHSEENKAIKM